MIDVSPVYLAGFTQDGLDRRQVLLGYKALGFNKRLGVTEFSFGKTISGAILGILAKLKPAGINLEEN